MEKLNCERCNAGLSGLYIDKDLEIVTCHSCGEEWSISNEDENKFTIEEIMLMLSIYDGSTSKARHNEIIKYCSKRLNYFDENIDSTKIDHWKQRASHG